MQPSNLLLRAKTTFPPSGHIPFSPADLSDEVHQSISTSSGIFSSPTTLSPLSYDYALDLPVPSETMAGVAPFAHSSKPDIGHLPLYAPSLHREGPAVVPSITPYLTTGSLPNRTVPSYRRSGRRDSAPYPSSISSSSCSSTRSSSSTSLSDFAGSDAEDDDGDWATSRRSSTSSTGWSSYDPRSGFEFDFEALGGVPVPHSEVAMAPMTGDEEKIQATKATLTRFAALIKEAATSSAQDRARGAFVQAWLGQSYQRCSDGNVSRQGLYGSYLKSCSIYGVKAINSASFGKAVRQKFPDIKTRRLGVRGASRYHYCGVQPSNTAEESLLAFYTKEEAGKGTGGGGAPSKPSDEEEEFEDIKTEEESIPPLAESPPPVSLSHSAATPAYSMLSVQGDYQPITPTTARPSIPNAPDQQQIDSRQGHRTVSSASSFQAPPHIPPPTQERRRAQSVILQAPKSIKPVSTFGKEKVGVFIADFPGLEEVPIEVRGFWGEFVKHCSSLLEAAKTSSLEQFEMCVRSWWTTLDAESKAIVVHPTVASLIYRADAAVYADVLAYLHSQILIALPPDAFAGLKNLADNMEHIYSIALAEFEGTGFGGPQVELAARFGHLITRHLGLCQLTQALSGIVSNPRNIEEMSEAWDLIDFDAIKNQSALVSNCEHDLLTECFAGFRHLLHNPGPSPIQSFIHWAEAAFERCISPSLKSSTATVHTSPRSLFIRWSFVTSQIMRDLTLRSAPTFGSFAIASTFLDEFLSLQVLRRVALQPAAVAAATGSNHSAPSFVPPHQQHFPTFSNGTFSSQVTSGMVRSYSSSSSTHYPVDGIAAFGLYDQAPSSTSSSLPDWTSNGMNHHQQHHQSQAQSFAPSFSTMSSSNLPLDFSTFSYDPSSAPSSSASSSFPRNVQHKQFRQPTPSGLVGCSGVDLATMDVERFGDLRFDSSPSNSSSPAGGQGALDALSPDSVSSK